jgi:hypothetical protein
VAKSKVAVREVVSPVRGSDGYRRVMGVVLGAGLGLVYEGAAQVVNRLAMPGVPYYPAPFGPLGNIALSVAWGGVLGALAAWPESVLWGVLLSSLAGAAAFVLRSVLGFGGGSLVPAASTAVVAGIFFLPAVLFNAPAMWVLRWATDRQVQAHEERADLLGMAAFDGSGSEAGHRPPESGNPGVYGSHRRAERGRPDGGRRPPESGRPERSDQVTTWAGEQRREQPALLNRVLVPGLLALVLAVAGAAGLLRPAARDMLAKTHVMLQEALRAADGAALPGALRAPEVGDFRRLSTASYHLDWTDRNLDNFGIQRPGTNFENQAVVTARFANGWTLDCLYYSTQDGPICRGHVEGQQ